MTRKEWAMEVRIAQVKKGLSTNALAKKAGLTRATIWKALAEQRVTQDTINRISDAAGVERIEK